VGGVLTGAMVITQWAAAALLTVVLTFVFVKDGGRLWDWIVCFFHDEKRPYGAFFPIVGAVLAGVAAVLVALAATGWPRPSPSR
jgi:predicted PurR-regulated permease PerM